jgi:hypothetical protein
VVLAAKFAHADDRSWAVYQDGFKCCAFFDLPSAQAFVRMQTEHGGNAYVIYKE